MRPTSHTPRKRFGQHFLCDQQVIQRIVTVLKPKPDEHLVEIGPGQGAITLPVMKVAEELEVVELDADLIPDLKDRVGRYGDLTVHLQDVLKFDFAAIKHDDRLLRVFGNLPYNISTPLIFHLLKYTVCISDMVFMVQKEVADRLAAPADSDTYGRLSVMVQYHCQVDLLFNVPPTAFHPPPKVDSSILRLLPYRQPPFVARNYELFKDMVRSAFGQRRKTIRNSLKHLISADAWPNMPVKPDLRAEKLTVQNFVDMCNALEQ